MSFEKNEMGTPFEANNKKIAYSHFGFTWLVWLYTWLILNNNVVYFH